ncbi:MAG: magnesium transporter MgtE [Planctomycetota bacterium]|nr:MAG: magnesium transporter MgtE [Planctomycetota bacterium]
MRPFTQLILPELREALEREDRALLEAAAEELLPTDLADVCAQLGPELAARLLTMLPVGRAAAAFEQLEPDLQLRLLEGLGRRRIGQILDEMSPDDRADLMARLPAPTVEALLPLLAQAERNDVRRLMQYPEETAGGLMTTEYVALPGELTVEQALKELRKVAPDRETIYTVYVVDAGRHLRGVVSLRDILTALPGKRLEEIMTEQPVCVRVDADQEEVAEQFERYDLTALPVVDAEGRLVGIITVDDVIDVIEAEATEDIQMLGGMQPLGEEYLATPIRLLVRKRVIWLVLLMMAQTLTALAIDGHRGLLDAALVASLVVFMPMINASGGNSGSQSATLLTRALAVGEVRFSDLARVLGRELVSGLAMGLIVGGCGVAFVLAMSGSVAPLVWVVGAALVAVTTIGSLLGALIPLVLDRIGIDPAVSSAPFIASVSDVISVTVYFGLARLVLA